MWIKYFEAAEKCQAQLAFAAKDNSLAQRYEIVLQELKLEATEQTRQTNQIQQQQQEQIHTNNTPSEAQVFQQSQMIDVPIDGGATPAKGQDSENRADLSVWAEGISEESPNSLMADLTSWEEFDSLVGLE